MMAALAGGAAFLGRGKGTAAADVDSGRGGTSASAIARAVANAPKITPKIKPIIKPIIKPVGSAVDRARVTAGKFIDKINDPNTPESSMQFITPTSERKLALLRGNAKPPSMRGGAKRAQGWAPRVYPNMSINQGAWSGLKKDGGRIGAKKGGSVTGAAKRGFGRALKKK